MKKMDGTRGWDAQYDRSYPPTKVWTALYITDQSLSCYHVEFTAPDGQVISAKLALKLARKELKTKEIIGLVSLRPGTAKRNNW